MGEKREEELGEEKQEPEWGMAGWLRGSGRGGIPSRRNIRSGRMMRWDTKQNRKTISGQHLEHLGHHGSIWEASRRTFGARAGQSRPTGAMGNPSDRNIESRYNFKSNLVPSMLLKFTIVTLTISADQPQSWVADSGLKCQHCNSRALFTGPPESLQLKNVRRM